MVILAHLIKYPPLSVSNMSQLAKQKETCTNRSSHPSKPEIEIEEFNHKCCLLVIFEASLQKWFREHIKCKVFGHCNKLREIRENINK